MRKLAVLLLCLSACAALAAQDGQPWDGPSAGIVISDKVRIREGPSVSARIVAVANTGDLFQIDGRSDDSVSLGQGYDKTWWYRIVLPENEGWIYGAFLYLEAKPVPNDAIVTQEGDVYFNGAKVKLTPCYYLPTPDHGNDPSAEPDYDDQTLVLLRDISEDPYDGPLWWVRLPKDKAQEAHVSTTPDGWLLLTSNMGFDEYVKSLKAMDGGQDLLLTLVQRTNGGNEYTIWLTCGLVATSRLRYLVVRSVHVDELGM
jgi:hypothetical protein